jgi:hypothetical protein
MVAVTCLGLVAIVKMATGRTARELSREQIIRVLRERLEE